MEEKMNDKYLLFLGDDYYPSGGWEDFSGYFDSPQEAIEKINSIEPYCKWAHIVFQEKIILRAKTIDDYCSTNGKWEIQYLV